MTATVIMELNGDFPNGPPEDTVTVLATWVCVKLPNGEVVC